MVDWHLAPVFGTPPSSGEATVRPSAYGIISGNVGRIAVVHMPTGISLPGGGIDAPESPEECVVRETLEECGLIVRIGQWRRNAIDHRFSIAERVQFEKHNTFCDATVVSADGIAIELDHVLEWMLVRDAAQRLSPLSHRWAVDEWRRSPTITPSREPSNHSSVTADQVIDPDHE